MKHVFLTGRPGVGKTTIIRKVCDELNLRNEQIVGFLTEEVRQNQKRIGFDVVCLPTNKRCSLARIESNEDFPNRQSSFKVGQYQVYVTGFENAVLPLLRTKSHVQFIVIDEIGKMELFSKTFKTCVESLLSSTEAVILGTLPIKKGNGILFVESIKQRSDVKLFEVTFENRNKLLPDILNALQIAPGPR